MRRKLLFLIIIASVGCEKNYDSNNTYTSKLELDSPKAPNQNLSRITNSNKSCAPLQTKHGFINIKFKTLQNSDKLKNEAVNSSKFYREVEIQVPDHADIRRLNSFNGGCEYARDIRIKYLWFKQKLIPMHEWIKFSVPSDYVNRSVEIILKEGSASNHVDNLPIEKWRINPAYPHKYLPLEYYPKFRWKNIHEPGYPSNYSGAWGVLKTKYKNYDGSNFTASCSIPIDELKSKNFKKLINAPMANFGDSKCNGRLSVENNGIIITFAIRNWKDTTPEINHIYDAAFDEIQSFLINNGSIK